MKFKTFLASIIIILSLFTVGHAEYFKDIILTSEDGLWTDVRAFSTLADAITAIGADTRTLVISSPQTITTLTVPSNITLKFERDGAINNSGLVTINTRNIIADSRQIFTGTGDIDFIAGMELDCGWFADFATAISRIGTTATILDIKTTKTVAGDITIPANVKLRFSPDAMLTINNGITVTIYSPKNIIALDNQQIFTGLGGVKFTGSSNNVTDRVYVDWFGAIGDNSTNSTDAILKANNSLPVQGGSLGFNAGIYRCGQIPIRSGTALIGEGGVRANTTLRFVGGLSESFLVKSPTISEVSGFRFQGIRLDDARVAPLAGYGIDLGNAVNGIYMYDFAILDFPSGGSTIGYVVDNTKSGDNFYIDYGWGSTNLSPMFVIGQTNNFVSISNIMCDGPYPVIKRNNGNSLSAVFKFSNIKHEGSTGFTINMFATDRYSASDIISTGDSFTAVIGPTSPYATYSNILGVNSAGTTSRPSFSNAAGTDLLTFSSALHEQRYISLDTGETVNSRIIRKADKVSITASGSTYLEIPFDLSSGSGFAGIMECYNVGDIRGISRASFSGYVAADGTVSSGDADVIGGSGSGYTYLTIDPPESMSPVSPTRMRIKLNNTHVAYPMSVFVEYTIIFTLGKARLGN